jgi:hypothetical protein
MDRANLLNFPLTFTTSYHNPFQRSSAFSADLNEPVVVRCESFENPRCFPTTRQMCNLRVIVRKIIHQLVIPHKNPGDKIRHVLSVLQRIKEDMLDDEVPVEKLCDAFEEHMNYKVSDVEKDAILAVFDLKTDGKVSLTRFANLVLGKMNERRVELVHIVYQMLLERSLKNDQPLNENVIRDNFIETSLTGEVDFLLLGLGFPNVNGGIASLEDFIDYYNLASAEMESNLNFEELIRQSWSI